MIVSCKKLKGALQASCPCLHENSHVYVDACSYCSQDATFVKTWCQCPAPHVQVRCLCTFQSQPHCIHLAASHACQDVSDPANLACNCFRAQSHLEEVQPQGRAVDKAFKRELGPLPYYPDLLLLYQDRSREYTYQADFRMAELDEMMTAPTSLVSQQEQKRTQAPVLGYAPPFPPPSLPLPNGLPALPCACTVIGDLIGFAGASCFVIHSIVSHVLFVSDKQGETNIQGGMYVGFRRHSALPVAHCMFAIKHVAPPQYSSDRHAVSITDLQLVELCVCTKCRVPFVQRILYERKAASQSSQPPQSSPECSPLRSSLVHQSSSIQPGRSQTVLQPTAQFPASPSASHKPSSCFSRSGSLAIFDDAAIPVRSSRMHTMISRCRLYSP